MDAEIPLWMTVLLFLFFIGMWVAPVFCLLMVIKWIYETVPLENGKPRQTTPVLKVFYASLPLAAAFAFAWPGFWQDVARKVFGPQPAHVRDYYYQPTQPAPGSIEALTHTAEWDATSQRLLGDKYLKGDGVTADSTQANAWFRKAADQGDAQAQAELAVSYAQGRGLPQNDEDAWYWFRRSGVVSPASVASTRNAVAARLTQTQKSRVEQRLKTARVNGPSATQQLNNVKLQKNPKKRLAGIRQLAQAGNIAAQVFLGNMYLSGDTTARDPAAAADWFRKAADAGNTEAQERLGICYARGQGIAKDDAEATFWFKLSGDKGMFDDIDLRTASEAALTDAQKAAIDQRLKDWKPRL